MGLFSKLVRDLGGTAPTAATPAARTVPPMGSGRRLHSDHDITRSLTILEAVLSQYRTPKYRHLPHYLVPGWSWLSQETVPPSTVVCFDDRDDNFLLGAFWATATGTDLGLYPLGSEYARLDQLPVVADWTQRDTSLTSIGTLPAGAIALTAPPIPDDYCKDMLSTARCPVTPANVVTVGQRTGQMFLIKAYEYISTEDRQLAERFVDQHRWDGEPFAPFYRGVFEDLIAWNPTVLPYIQQLPTRIRALLLEHVEVQGSLWSELPDRGA